MKLSNYAKNLGITYRTAWTHFKLNKIPGAVKLDSGRIYIPENNRQLEHRTAVYARVSSSENKGNLRLQSRRIQDFCAAKGWVIHEIVEECASGLNDARPKLLKLLENRGITRIVVEHKDRLTRFGFNYLQKLWPGEIVVINQVSENESDLMQDFVSLVTSFTARLYGQRRSKRKTEQLIKELSTSKC